MPKTSLLDEVIQQLNVLSLEQLLEVRAKVDALIESKSSSQDKATTTSLSNQPYSARGYFTKTYKKTDPQYQSLLKFWKQANVERINFVGSSGNTENAEDAENLKVVFIDETKSEAESVPSAVQATVVIGLIDENDVIPYRNAPVSLSERDCDYLVSVMENPPQPSEGLLSVFD